MKYSNPNPAKSVGKSMFVLFSNPSGVEMHCDESTCWHWLFAISGSSEEVTNFDTVPPPVVGQDIHTHCGFGSDINAEKGAKDLSPQYLLQFQELNH
jgi:hypothetical protein